MSHICLSCGRDLARVRALVEPHYGLPVVVCPDCGRAVVRRRAPIIVRWRQFRRLRRSVLGLAWRVGVLAAALGATVPVILNLASDLFRGGLRGPVGIFKAMIGLDLAGRRVLVSWFESNQYEIVGVLAASLMVGVALRLALSHLGRGNALIVWIVLLTLCLSLDPFWEMIGAWVMGVEDKASVDLFPPVREWLLRLMIATLTVGVSAVGLPIGAAAERAMTDRRSFAWRRKYVRQHARRAGA